MAHDPVNQQQFAKDVAAAAAAGNGESFVDVDNLNGDFEMPNLDEVWKALEQMKGISDEDREKLRKSLLVSQDGETPQDFMKRLPQPDLRHSSGDYMIFFVMIAIIVLVFALFGYKLYKSLKEKELKKQEKLKTKHSKKTKKVN